MVLDCKQVLQKVKLNHSVSIEWVKSHDDDTGNELADHLAKEGSNMKCDATIPIIATHSLRSKNGLQITLREYGNRNGTLLWSVAKQNSSFQK